ncbi:UNVERIFIED_CONTAM: hypothetical protein Slati_2896000 [Sesamum latifolium]|uniref:Reverse transcriptase domain-containing protein n=1 Tax=Sesamum latifolium TaxID=2727402 RepID=A0AAW2VCV3_9LAMI
MSDQKEKRKMTDMNHEIRDALDEPLEKTGRERRVEAVQELKVIDLSENDEKTTKIDLHGISPNVITHWFIENPNAKPVKQKKRMFGVEISQAIKEEVDKLLKAKYIRPVQYPKWLANVVVVPKPNEKWRLYIDFIDLNKACPKDPFPLPWIDILADSTSGFEMLSFLDAYQGYNQIPLAPEDQEKANFVTNQGIFCYNIMHFRLKNCRSNIPTTCQSHVPKSDWPKYGDLHR